MEAAFSGRHSTVRPGAIRGCVTTMRPSTRAFYCPAVGDPHGPIPMTEPMENEARVVLVTCPPGEPAVALARALVDERLAACVNVLPGVTSVYRWQGERQEEGEAVLVVKTTAGRLRDLEGRLASLHPYDVFECIALAPARVEARYLAWLVESVDGGAGTAG